MNYLLAFVTNKTITIGDELRHIIPLMTHEDIEIAMRQKMFIMTGTGANLEEAKKNFLMRMKKIDSKTGDQLSDH